MASISTEDGYSFHLVDNDGDFLAIDPLSGVMRVGDSSDETGKTGHSVHFQTHDLKMLRVWLDEAIKEMEEQDADT